ncbi:DUF4407 domain-containing protein [Flavobacterium sp. XGLA_31]|uniref:DUF4407 domain-containing protein n=1 Tax=Flavobacterium sp. XGLA_31 TaxID=3447666 RepID=UPI003F2EE83F
MNKVVSDIRLFLFTCSGEDNYILKRCNNSMQLRFALIGFFVVCIFVGCFLSAYCFVDSLFNGASWISFPLGIIWGAIVVNIYLLLLHTISPAIIPLLAKKKRGVTTEIEETESKSTFLSLSMFLRIGFMMMLAIIIAQPLNVLALKSSVSTSIEKHKVTERVKLYMANNASLIDEELLNQQDFNQRLNYFSGAQNDIQISRHLTLINSKINDDKQFAKEAQIKLNELNKIEHCSSITARQNQQREKLIQSLDGLLNNVLTSDINFTTSLSSISFVGVLKNDGDVFKNKLLYLVNEKINNYNALNDLLNRSNFYVKTIQLLLAENPVSWFLTFGVCLVFLLPIIFKYKVRDLSAKLFAEKDYDIEIKRLRSELINTTDFKWLEKKIKATTIQEIRTSDYYFQRMLIEHKIILEEYAKAKKQFSKILTANIKRYNQNSFLRLQPLLDKLQTINPKRYQEYHRQILEDYKEEIIIKYEYWLDMPFRTKRVHTVSISNTEVGLLDFVYNRTDEGESPDEI